MALANILSTESAVHVPGVWSSNASVTVRVGSKNVLLSDYLQNVLTVELGDSYLVGEDVVAHVAVEALGSYYDTTCSGSSGVVVSPASIWFAGGTESSVDPVNIYVGSSCPGRYQVTVRMYFAHGCNSATPQNSSLIHNIQVSYSNGREFEIFSSDESFEAPQVTAASFLGSVNEVVLSFDSSTNYAGLKEQSFDCGVLLFFAAASSTRCFWRDSSHLIINLNSESTLLPGDVITVLPDNIGSSSENVLFQLSLSNSTEVQVTSGADVFPVIMVDAPRQQSACASFTLDLTHSTGFVGRDWANSSVTVRVGTVGEDAMLVADETVTALAMLNDFFTHQYNIQAATVLPVGYLEAGHMYVFDVHVCNCLGMCAAASHRLWVTPMSFPYTTMHESAVAKLTFARGDAVSIPTSVVNMPCASESSFSRASVSQVWTIVAAHTAVSVANPEPLLVVSSDELESLTLPAYSFPSATLYEIYEVVEVTVVDILTNVQSNMTFKNLVVVRVSKSLIKAVLSAGEHHILLGVNETESIDASGSYDSNLLLAGASSSHIESLHFVWECVRMGPLTADAPNTDCAGFLQVNGSLHWQAVVSPSFVEHEVGSPLDSEYRITVVVYSADMSEYDRVVLTASVISVCCISMELEPVELYNVQKDLSVMARVQSSTRGYVAWTVGTIESLVLSDSALTPTSMVFEGAILSDVSSHVVSLKLPPNLLQAGFSYSVRLTFVPLLDGQEMGDEPSWDDSSIYSAIDIVPNSSPLPGTFIVTPREGLSLFDDFSFLAKLWSSTQLPLLYTFGFRSVSSGLMVPVQVRGMGVSMSVKLPQGSKPLDYMLTCVLQVNDNVNASSEATNTVKVTPSGITRFELSSALEDLSDNDSLDFESSFGPLLESVTEVNCSLAPDCSSLYNRQNCSSVEHTCGPCLSAEDFFGEDGHHNSRCARRTDLLMKSFTLESRRSSCSDDSTCPVFQSCVEGECTSVVKQCANDCSGHGVCRHVVSDTGAGMAYGTCVVGDTSCSAECACDAEWFGRGCLSSEVDMLLDSVLYRQVMCLFANEVMQSLEASEEEVSAWVDQLSMMSQEPSTFTHESALCSLEAQDYILGVIKDSSVNFSVSVIQKILDSVATVLEYHKYFDYRNQTYVQKAERLYKARMVLSTYCDVISGGMAQGQYPVESARSRLRVVTTSQKLGGETVSEVTFSTSEQESYNDLQTPAVSLIPFSSGGVCLVSLDTIVYGDLADGLLKSNSLAVVLPGANVSSLDSSTRRVTEQSFSMTLEDVADMDLLSVLPRTSHNVTCAEAYFGTHLYLACPHNKTHELYCDENAVGMWEVTCPSVTTNMTCRSLQPVVEGLSVSDGGCEVVSISASSVTCECPTSTLYTRSIGGTNGNGDTVEVEFSAMLEFVVEDFVSTWKTVDDLSAASVEESKSVLITLGFLMSFVTLGLYFSDNADSKHGMGVNKRKKRRAILATRRERDQEAKATSGTNSDYVVDLDALFPSILTETPFILLFLEEIKKSHRWASIYFNYDKRFPRALRFLSLTSVVICTLFFNSLLYNVTNPDDGSCRTYSSESECLAEPSQYSNQDTKCLWRDATFDREGACRFKEPSSSAVTMIYVSMLSAIFSIPFVIVFEFIIMEVLSRPTADSLSSVQPSNAVLGNSSETDEKDSTAEDELLELMSGLLKHFQSVSAEERRELEMLWGLSCTQLESCEESLFGPHRACLKRSNMSVPPVASHGTHSVRPSSITSEDVEANEVDVISSARPSMIQRFLRTNKNHEEDVTIHNVLRDIIAMRERVREESLEFSSMSPQQQGIRLLVLFQKDLLSGVTGDIAEKKSMRGKQVDRKSVSKWAKVGGYAFIFILNLTLLFYIFLFAINQDQSRQSAWVQSFIIWLALEIFLVSSLAMLMSQFVVPSLVYSEVKKIKNKMIDMIHSYQSRMLHQQSSAERDYLAVSSFDVAPYLYISTRLALKYPDTLESKIIRDFKTVVPKRSYQHSKKSSMNVYRSRLRLTAVMNSVNLVFLYIIGHILALPISSVERCFYDLLSWVVIGFSFIFQAVLFADNALVTFLVYVSFMCALGTFVYYYHRSSRRLRSSNKKRGVISIKEILEEKKRNVKQQFVQWSPQEVIMRNFVDMLQGKQKVKRKKFNPRFARIMESLKNNPALRERLHSEDHIHDEDKSEGDEKDHSEGDGAHSMTSRPDALSLEKNSSLIGKKDQVELNMDFMHSKDSNAVDEMEDQTSHPPRSDDITGAMMQASRTAEIEVFDDVDIRRQSQQKRTADVKAKLKLELGLDSDDSDIYSSSDDSYVGSLLEKDSVIFSSSESEDDECGDFINVTASPSAPPAASAFHSSATQREADIQRDVINKIFTKPKSVSSLASRIRQNRDGIRRLSLQKHAREIEDIYETNTRARRASIFANQTRAQEKLQKRREKRKSVSQVDKTDINNAHSQLHSTDVNSSSAVDGYKKMNSLELFNEKKALVKSFAVHDTKRKKTLNEQQQGAKESLQRRVESRGKARTDI